MLIKSLNYALNSHELLGVWLLSYLQIRSSFLLCLFMKLVRNNTEVLFLGGSGKKGYCCISACSSRMWLYKSLPSCVFCGDKQGVLQTEQRHYWSWLILRHAHVQEENLLIFLWHVKFYSYLGLFKEVVQYIYIYIYIYILVVGRYRR